MFDAAELADLYDELGTKVRYTSPAGVASWPRVIFAEPGQIVLGDGVVTTEPTARFMRGIEVVRDGVFEIGGKSWRVRQSPMSLTDGLELQAALEVVK